MNSCCKDIGDFRACLPGTAKKLSIADPQGELLLVWKRMELKFFLVATSGFLWFTTANLYQWPVVVTRKKASDNDKAKKLEEIAVN